MTVLVRALWFLHKRKIMTKGNISSYTTESQGASTSFSYPISEVQNIGFGLGYENLELDSGGSFKTRLMEKFLDEEGEDYHIFTSNLSWGVSTLNGAGLDATRGSIAQNISRVNFAGG